MTGTIPATGTEGPLGITDKHIPALDGLRGIAACTVVVAHMLALHITNGFGPLAVQVFFAISGLLITWLLLNEAEKTGDISLKDFYWRRTLRIFPAFYVVWGITLVVYLCLGMPLGRTPFFSAIYCDDICVARAYLDGTGPAWFEKYSFMRHSWSLGVEEKFYFFWPLCVWFFRRRLKLVAGIAITLIAVTWAYRWVCLACHVNASYLYFAPEARMDGIMAGCTLAVAAKIGGARTARIIRLLAAKPIYALYTVAGLVLSELISGYSAYWSAVGGISIQAILATVLLCQLIQLAPRSGWGWLDSPVCKFLAGISYSLYLWHSTVVMVAERVFQPRPRSASITKHFLGVGIRDAVILVLTFGLAVASFYLIERPCLRWRQRRAAKQTAIAALPAII